MKSIKHFLERWGIHCFLLPVFFVLHNYKQYYGLVSGSVAMDIAWKIMTIVVLSFLLLLLLVRHANRAMQVVTVLGAVYFFFGVIKDFIEKTLHLGFFSRYIILVPVLLVIIIVLIVIVARKKTFSRSNLFQNVLLFLFILFDAVSLVAAGSGFFLKQNLLVKKDILSVDQLPTPAATPDVYYLLLDSYPGTSYLKEYMQYDNSPFNFALEQRGFHVIAKPTSNYNRTAFSLASTLNFEYLPAITANHALASKEYNQARLSIEYAAVPAVFNKLGYSFYNLSVFDFPGQPSIRRESFLTMPERNVLLFNTFWERVKKDLLWNIITGNYVIQSIQDKARKAADELRKGEVQKRDYNNRIIDSMLQVPAIKSTAPKFIYAHVYLPHPPFFYDRNGKENDPAYVVTEASLKNKELFLSYLEYTNKIVLNIVDSLQHKSAKQPVIILQSDHGFRDFTGGPAAHEVYFTNYSAFYFPDKEYGQLYDTMSNVNTFPVLFNKYFNTHIPLQPDTSVFLAY